MNAKSKRVVMGVIASVALLSFYHATNFIAALSLFALLWLGDMRG